MTILVRANTVFSPPPCGIDPTRPGAAQHLPAPGQSAFHRPPIAGNARVVGVMTQTQVCETYERPFTVIRASVPGMCSSPQAFNACSTGRSDLPRGVSS